MALADRIPQMNITKMDQAVTGDGVLSSCQERLRTWQCSDHILSHMHDIQHAFSKPLLPGMRLLVHGTDSNVNLR